MNFLTADDALQDRLRGILEPVEIRDPEGKVLGHFTPLVTPEQRAAYERTAKLFDLREMEQLACTEQTGCSFEHVREYFRPMDDSK